MGVTGLLQMLKPICANGHISCFAQQRVGIDAYSWLHRGAHGCATDLCTDMPTNRFVLYFRNRLAMLQHYKVVPVVVFDGDRLPMKAAEESDRKRRREEYLAKGKAALADSNFADADASFQRAVEVTTSMAYEVIKLCRDMGVDYIVAPYEADAQLAYMSLHGHISAVISEDSDLVVYGVTRTFLKLDKFGAGVLLDSTKLSAMTEPDFAYFTREMVVYMCVLAGCDFFPGIKGVGVRTAHMLVRKYKTVERLIQLFRFSHKYKDVPKDFEEQFRRACLVFSHQRVFDRNRRKVVLLREFEDGNVLAECEGETGSHFLGPPMADDVACAIAEGKMDPITRAPFQLQDSPVHRRSIPGNAVRKRMSQPLASRDRGRSSKSIDKFLRKASKQAMESGMVTPFRPPRRLFGDCKEGTDTGKQEPQEPGRGKLTSFFTKLSSRPPLDLRASDPPGREMIVTCPQQTPPLDSNGDGDRPNESTTAQEKRLTLTLQRNPERRARGRAFTSLDRLRCARETGQKWDQRLITEDLFVPATPPRKRNRVMALHTSTGSLQDDVVVEDSLDSSVDAEEKGPQASSTAPF